jgi:L-ascorbate metabolism protein UlaG (beta-lactamase superfamily)
MNPARAAEAAAILRPRLAVPIHWGTFYPAGLRHVIRAPFETPGLAFEAAARDVAPDVPVRVLMPGESVAIPAR